MTTAERLVRQACRARLQELAIEERTAIEQIPTEIAFTKLPQSLQAALIEKRQLEQRIAEIEKRLAAAGFRAYDAAPYKPLRYDTVDKKRLVVRAEATRRREAVERLQTTMSIAVIGSTPEQARKQLVLLLRDLGRI